MWSHVTDTYSLYHPLPSPAVPACPQEAAESGAPATEGLGEGCSAEVRQVHPLSAGRAQQHGWRSKGELQIWSQWSSGELLQLSVLSLGGINTTP